MLGSDSDRIRQIYLFDLNESQVKTCVSKPNNVILSKTSKSPKLVDLVLIQIESKQICFIDLNESQVYLYLLHYSSRCV